MTAPNDFLRTGIDLQLVIAASHDLPRTLAPHRERRQRRQATVAATVGGATSALVGTAVWAANLGFWAGLGAALGLGSIPLIVTLAGSGRFALGFGKRGKSDAPLAPELLEQLALTYACFVIMAQADGHVSREEETILRSVLLQFPLGDDELQQIQDQDPRAIVARGKACGAAVCQEVLRGTWMLAEADGVTAAEEQTFVELSTVLDQSAQAALLKRESRATQAELDDLTVAMFRTCQEALSPALASPTAQRFLEALSQIAATPTTRRSLGNALTAGHSPGGVTRLLDTHGAAEKLLAQGYNGIRAVHGANSGEAKTARQRLLELSAGTRVGGTAGKAICADLDALYADALAHAATRGSA